jgi:hypothetical protein
MTNVTSLFADWTEERHQEELFLWANREIANGRETLRLLGAIPNGISVLRWKALRNRKELGFRKGIPDVYFFLPKGRWHGLFIELKSLKSSAKASNSQLVMLDLLYGSGYQTAICRGFAEAIKVIDGYEKTES